MWHRIEPKHAQYCVVNTKPPKIHLSLCAIYRIEVCTYMPVNNTQSMGIFLGKMLLWKYRIKYDVLLICWFVYPFIYYVSENSWKAMCVIFHDERNRLSLSHKFEHVIVSCPLSSHLESSINCANENTFKFTMYFRRNTAICFNQTTKKKTTIISIVKSDNLIFIC